MLSFERNRLYLGSTNVCVCFFFLPESEDQAPCHASVIRFTVSSSTTLIKLTRTISYYIKVSGIKQAAIER